MFSGRSVLAVIPARGGSKGVPLKNIRPLYGRPLLGHIAPVLKALTCIDRAVVSTDDSRIADVAQEFGLEVPFYRPHDLSGDSIGDVPVLQHAVSETERLEARRYDVIVMLQPTCPLRTPDHVRRVIATLIEGNWDAAWTISRCDPKYHPMKQLRLCDSTLGYYDPAGAHVTARQQLEQLYFRNGAAYALTRQCLMEQGTLLSPRTTGVLIEERLVNIDTVEDFQTAEAVLRHRLGRKPGPQQ